MLSCHQQTVACVVFINPQHLDFAGINIILSRSYVKFNVNKDLTESYNHVSIKVTNITLYLRSSWIQKGSSIFTLGAYKKELCGLRHL